MTERLAAMRALTMKGKCPERDKALADFEQNWKHNPIVMDKWFAVQAGQGTAATVAELAAHPDFDLKNPNRVRAVIAVFSTANLAAFHAPDGSGYRAVEDIILKADAANPALAARLLAAFEQWRVLEPKAGAAAQATLKRLQEAKLSPNSADIVGRALG
jgi:aminopeptidase N